MTHAARSTGRPGRGRASRRPDAGPVGRGAVGYTDGDARVRRSIATLAVLVLVGCRERRVGAYARTTSRRPRRRTRCSLPDRLYEPSPWLPGTDETGPIGGGRARAADRCVARTATGVRASRPTGGVHVPRPAGLGRPEASEPTRSRRTGAGWRTGSPATPTGEPNTSSTARRRSSASASTTPSPARPSATSCRPSTGCRSTTLEWGGSDALGRATLQYVEGGRREPTSML